MQRTQRTIWRAGVTLVELLVVITIMVMLMAYATSIVKPQLEDRKSRESAQLLNSYFTNAQAKAAELGRPVGVYLERSANDDNKVLQLYTAITPPPFVGGTAGSRALITRVENTDPRAVPDPNNANQVLGFDTDNDGDVDVPWIYEATAFDTAGNADSFVAHPLVKRGDTIKFNYMGRTFQILSVARSNATPTPPPPNEGVNTAFLPGKFEFIATDDDAMRNGPEPVHLESKSLPFQIFRGPQKSIAAPVELPTGMAIDLVASGFGHDGFEFDANGPNDLSPVVIMYRPSGDLDYVYFDRTKERPVEPLHLLIGSFEFDSNDPATAAGNLSDPRNRWIPIRPRGGDVFATKIHVDESNPPTTVNATEIDKSRLDIRDRQRRP